MPPDTGFPVNAYVDLIRKASLQLHGRSFGIYCHKLGDPLPPLSYTYSDYRTVCSSIMLRLDDQKWVFISNAKSGIKDSVVRLYCSSDTQFIYPLADQFRDFLVHFFPSKRTLQVFHCSDVTTNDSNGVLTSLLNLYCTIIADRSVKFNIMTDDKMAQRVTAAFQESIEKKHLLRFTDNECYSVFMPTYDVAPSPSYSVEYVTESELNRMRQVMPANPDMSNSSDDDFEITRPFKKPKLATEDIPTYVEPSKGDKLNSRKRLDSIKALCQDAERHSGIKRRKEDSKPENKCLTVVSDGQTAVTQIEAIVIPGAQNASDGDGLPSDQSIDKHSGLKLKTDGLPGVGKFGSVPHVEGALESKDKNILDSYKSKMICRNIDCIRVKTQRTLHYHCLSCKTYSYYNFMRVLTHMSKCSMACKFEMDAQKSTTSRPDTEQASSVLTNNTCNKDTAVAVTGSSGSEKTGAAVSKTALNPELRVCWDRTSSCVVSSTRPMKKHYHCTICDTSHVSIARMEHHLEKCKKVKDSLRRSQTTKSDKCPSGLHQAVLICAETGTYLVRRSTQGPASPVHVIHSKSGWDCSAPLCKDLHNFHSGSLNPGFMCEHVLSCVNRNLTPPPDLIQNVTSFESFGDDDKEHIIAFCKTATDFGLPVIKQFLPTLVDSSSTSRYIYYSVFAGNEKPKYYSKLGRVLVTYDRVNKTHRCDCGIKSCLHRKVAVLVSELNPLVKEARPEDESDENELKFAEQMINYVLQFKRIPFDVSEYKKPVPKTEFCPAETKCYKCDNVDLVTSNISNRGCIFTLYEKKTGISVVTKCCPNCSMQYRYAEYTEGYFNFNNSSFFSISLMEQVLKAWTKNTSLASFLDIMNVDTDVSYNVHLILDAVKAYLALKDMNLNDNLNCYRCGHFPVYLTYDVIRSVCFDVKPGEVTNHEYNSSNSMHTHCSQNNLARCYLNKKSPHYNSNVDHFSLRLGQTMPPVVSSKNFSGIDPYTRPLISDDKAEEITLPLERIEQLVNSKNSYKHLKGICNSLNIDTRGGKSHMVARLLDNEGNTQLYSVVRKNFTKISGKSGGVLRAFCPHGVCYGLKFLSLPESVADYANLITSFKVQPSFNFSDISTTWANHMENHYPGFFRPYRGRLGDPQDPKSEMLKDGRKTAVFNHKTYTTCEIDADNYNHYSVHPVSLLSSALLLFDIFHESNQNLADTYLRSVKCTNLAPYLNTSVVEQQNHVLALTKSFCNEMSPEQHILFVSYLTSVHNKSINDKWRRRVEKNIGEQCDVDKLGFLVRNDVDKSAHKARYDAPPTSDLKSPHPLPVLQDPSADSSALNSIVYSVTLSLLAEPILNDAKCLSNELVSYVSGKSVYNQPTHFKMKKLIDKQILEAGKSVIDPCSIFSVSFLPDLKRLGVLVEMSTTPSLNMGIGLDAVVQSLSSVVDYVVLTQPNPARFFNGVSNHFDVTYHGDKLRYDVVGFVSKTSEATYSGFVGVGDNLYEMCNTKSNLLSRHAYLEFCRAACLVILKLSTPISLKNNVNQLQERSQGKASHVAVDVFDFEPASGFKRAQAPAPIKRKKLKINAGTKAPISSLPNNWLSSSDTGRLDMYSEQYRICQSPTAWYDDVIINSYALMCKRYRSDSFTFQDTCLASPYCTRGFDPVDNKFIQIINPQNNHWFCVSNALTYKEETNVVEVFDSLQSAKSLQNVTSVDQATSRYILQLRPYTTVVRYIETQYQLNNYDCGPLALSFLWALSMGHHPRQYDHLRGPVIRGKVRQTFVQNRFVSPCVTSPRGYPKKVLKSFYLNQRSKSFTCE